MRLRPYEYSYFQPSWPPSVKLADMFTDVECFLWQGAGPTTSCLTATQDSETATDATWSDGRAAQDGSGTVPTLSGDLQAAEICVRARQWSNASRPNTVSILVPKGLSVTVMVKVPQPEAHTGAYLTHIVYNHGQELGLAALSGQSIGLIIFN